MYNELSKEHEVDVFAFNGNSLFLAGTYNKTVEYDLALINHNTCLNMFKDAPNIGVKIFTSHGVIPGLERAIPGADAYVGVSEETAGAMTFDASVIRNPIDTDKFFPWLPAREEPESVLFLSTHQGKALGVIQEACRKKGFRLETLGRINVSDNVEDYINRADIVVGLGRSAYEGMACERNVVVFDYRGGDGFVTPDNVHRFNNNNCSGRYSNKMFTPEELAEEFDKYDWKVGVQLREYVEKEHRPDVVVGKYLDLFKSIQLSATFSHPA